MADQGQPRRAVPPAIITVDTYGRMIRVDDAGVALLGAPEQDLAAADATIVLRLPDGTPVPPDEHPAMVAIRTGRPVPPAVYALERLYERWAWVRVSAVPAPSGADVELIDLSDDEALIAALERARRLESVLHQIDDYVYVWEYLPDGSSRPIAESIPSRKFFGIDGRAGRSRGRGPVAPARASGRPPPVRRGHGRRRPRAAAAPASTGWRTRTARSSTSSTAGTASCGATASRSSQGVISDVTTMRVAEAAERASEERFRVLAEAAPVGIYIADAEGKVGYANDRWHEIYALDGQEAVGDGWIEAVHPDDRDAALEAWRAAVAGGTTFHATFRLWRPGPRGALDREPRLPAARRGRRVTGYVGTDDDVTERVRATQELERLSQTDALTGLANRRRINERIETAVAQARGERRHARRADARRRPLQGGQRRLRAPGRRRRARGHRDPHRRGAAGRRGGRPLGRRGVHRARARRPATRRR